MKLLLALLLCLVTLPAFAASQAYATDPLGAGRHWQPTPDGVCYENDQVLFLCGGFSEVKTRSFWKGETTTWRVVDPSKLFAKAPVGGKLTTEQANAIILAQVQQPFYDRSERRQVRFLGAGLALDVVGTAAGISSGMCSEAGPIARHLPVLSVAINGYYFVHTRNLARATPRYFTTSKDRLPYVVGATHAVAGLHNLLTCT
jgi:hypothetical protein